MIDPLKSANRILRDNPDLADVLFDLFICARWAQGAIVEVDLDETEDYIYSKTRHAQKRKERYSKERLHGGSRSQPTKAELPV